MVLPRYELLFVREVGFDRGAASTVRRIAVALRDPSSGALLSRVLTGTLCHASGALSVDVGEVSALSASHVVRRSAPFPVIVTESLGEDPVGRRTYTLYHESEGGEQQRAAREERVRHFDAEHAFRCNGRMVEGYTPLVTLRAPADYLDDL